MQHPASQFRDHNVVPNIFIMSRISEIFLASAVIAVASCLPANPNGIPPAAGRPLIIKSFPEIPDFQSDLYEVYAEPYHFDIRPLSAVAQLQGEGENAVKGEIIFLQRNPPAGPVFIEGNFTGLTQGKHGLHIHQSGDLREGCEKLGGHFNPYLLQHGNFLDPLRHVGDLGNLEAAENGEAKIELVDPVMSLTGLRGVVGRAIVVTSGEDDLGRGNNAESVSNGNAGSPLACGIIAYVR